MKITNVIAGRMIRSGARDERNDPTRTAGTLPRMSDVVTEEFDMAEGGAEGGGERQRYGLGEVSSRELVCAKCWVHEQEEDDHERSAPTEVMPTMIPPTMPMATVVIGRRARSWTTPCLA